ncbi:MAG: hypothetical protein Q4A32_00070 [Lachnospiraceae bacterium]|nr:hypothetical protein [Lachnospiraceae bacterium]
MQSITLEQGGLLRLYPHEIPVIQEILSKKAMSWECLDAKQGIFKFPQQYIGYIGLPDRKIIIKPKHPGITISHILRVYFFLYSAQYSDLDTPMYDVETGNDVNLMAMFIQEMLSVVHKGLPVEYIEKEEDLSFIKGNLQVVPTSLNIMMRRRDAFRCIYDDLTRDIPINRLLLAAAKKIESHVQSPEITYIIRQFGNVDYANVPDDVVFNKNTAYCKKAASLAYMILNDLTLSTDGDSSSGESLLINFDKVFEDFIKKILMDYSNLGKFSYWTSPKSFAFCHQGDEYLERSYLPDLLYDYVDKNGRQTARAILDMKNKTSLPFQNDDIYQMVFYGQMLSCKKIVLCYPGNEDKSNTVLLFNDERFFLHKIYASYMNLAGNSAKQFKENIASFVYRVECLL